MQFNADQLVSIIGSKELEIIALRAEMAAMQKRIEELTPKPEPKE
jgi:hypothetical protein